MKNQKYKEQYIEKTRFSPNIDSGLSLSQVKYREKNNEINKTVDENEKTYLQIIFGNIFTFFNLLMISLAAVLIFLVGPETILNLSFLLLMVINTIISTIQECKSKHAIKKLKLISASKIEAIRSGITKEIFVDEIVLDDIIKLKAGDQIPADCILKSDDLVEVNESLLTGESRAIKKSKEDVLLAGSFIISGSCKAQVNKIGNDTYLHSIEAKAKGFKKPKSKLMLSINRIIKILASIAIPLAIIVFVNEVLRPGDLDNIKNAIFYSSLTIPYMIPAGMMLLSSISMATGVITLGKKKVLAQDLYSVEALSRVDTLCLDKTGTLTDGTMTVEKTITIKTGDTEGIISSYLSAFETSNQTSDALIKKYGKDQIYKIKNKIEFSSARKYSAVEFENGEIYILGAPEYLTDDTTILNQAKEYSKQGNRTLLMEKITGEIINGELKKSISEHFAIFIIRDNIRSEVPETMRWFRENGVDIKVISGDNAETVSYIAKKSGIKNWNKVLDMSALTKEDNLEILVLTNSIFARVTPEQKAEIVDILKKNKKIVAMSGDGVNDIISLKKADCSIALANGTPATKNISNLVLLDSNFNNMKEAVFEGRRVVNNIQRSSTLFVMKDFLWMFITIWPILIGAPHVIEASVIGIVNTFITGIGSFFLALEPDRSRIEGNFLKNIIGKSIVSGFFMFLPIILAYIYSFIVCGLDVDTVSLFIKTNMYPLISICITICGFVIMFKLCRPFTKFRAWLFALLLITVIILLLLVPDLCLRKSTDYIKELISIYGFDILAILKAIWDSILTFTIYKTLTTGQWIIMVIFCLLSTALYSITDYAVSKFLNITMFNPKRFEETDD